jgi:hypothetical protein
MKTILLSFGLLALLAGSAAAAERLNDAQMDRITGGDSCMSTGAGSTCSSSNNCPGCNPPGTFTPSSPQTLFQDYLNFLQQHGYPPPH